MSTAVLIVVALAAGPQDPQPPAPPVTPSATTVAQPTGGTSTAPPLRWPSFFTLHVENDSAPGAGDDDSYTQGLELHTAAPRDWPVVTRATRALWQWLPNSSSETPELAANNLVIGQTMFTPHNLLTYFPSPADRPYVAHLYAGMETTLARLNETTEVNDDGTLGRTYKPARLTLTVLAGMIGPAAFGRDAQSGWHVLRENRLVKGWFSQSDNEPQLNVRAAYDHIPLRSPELRRFSTDLTLSEELALGTTQTQAGGGATLRIGYNLSGFPATGIAQRALRVPSQAPRRFEVALQAGARGRYYARNTFIAGTFRDPTELETVRGVSEVSVGAELRWKHWRTTYQVVQRSKEYSPVPDGLPSSHRFVAVNISREPWEGDTGTPSTRFDWLKNGARANLRFGRGWSSVKPDRPLDPDPSLAASLGLEHAVTIGKVRMSVGFEQSGVGREEGQPNGALTHSDLFVTARAFTLGWEPTPAGSRHKLQVRAGGGRAAVKLQVTPDTRTFREPEPIGRVDGGRVWLGGIRYALRVGRPVSFVLDLSRNGIRSDDAAVSRADSTALTFGLQIHPWSRDTTR